MADRTGAATSSGPPGRPAALPSLTGLRWVAAMLVFFSHASLLSGPNRPDAPLNLFANHRIAKGLSDVFGPGYVAVSFFFVLSGFVLAWSTKPGERATAFWRRRALKIYPNHIVVFVIAMWLFASSTPMHAWLPNLFLVHTWSNQPEVISSVNLPAWSLCVEVFAYALFPLLLMLLRRIPESRLWLWAGGMVACVVGVPVVTQLFVSGGVRIPMYHLWMNQLWFSYGFPPMRLFEFGLGMVLARIVAAGLWPRIGLVASAVAFGAGYWLTFALPYPYRFYVGTIIPFGMLICAAAAKDVRGEGGWLASRPMVWLGNVSFAFYVVQGVVMFWGRPRVLDARTYGVVPALGLLIALFLANLLAGWLLYRLVEMPVMRRWSRSRKRPSQAAPRSTESVPVGKAA
ncbi:acyltransferase family protein [Streptomyces sp. MMG1121]|uniref:acyltransferase family protein n=1 Tax=Streptomyces sp. MMG1121 TaxID=1415544 RepID=UPI0006C0D869|nr:acyltransferase [Streptomyces sp. MMG1121]KOV57736.1 acyltransferase [Streptomyces sp. MMG1121]